MWAAAQGNRVWFELQSRRSNQRNYKWPRKAAEKIKNLRCDKTDWSWKELIV